MRRPTAAVLLAASLALAACGGAPDQDEVATDAASETGTDTTAAPAAPRPATGGAVDVPEELDFVAPDVRGGQVVGAELAGRDLVIWFWAPW